MTANRKKRFFSIFIDYLVIVAYALCLAGFSMLLFTLVLKTGVPALNELQGNLVSFFTLLFPVFLYLVITESRVRHATIGKRKAGICVYSVIGDLAMWQIIVRNIFKLLPWQIAHMAMFNALANDARPTMFFYICIIFVYVFPITSAMFMVVRKDRRSLHDLIAKTAVMEK